MYCHPVRPSIRSSVCPSFRHPSIHLFFRLIFTERLLWTRHTTESPETEFGANQDRTLGLSAIKAPCFFLFFVSPGDGSGVVGETGDGPGGTGWGSDGA